MRGDVPKDLAQEEPARVEETKGNGRPNLRKGEYVSGLDKLSTRRSALRAAQKAKYEECESLWEATVDPAFWLKT